MGVWGGQSKDGPDTGHFASETAVGLRGSGLLVAGLCRASRRRAELSTRPLCGGSLSRGVGGRAANFLLMDRSPEPRETSRWASFLLLPPGLCSQTF